MITFIWLQRGAASYEVAAWLSTKTRYLVSVSHFSCWCHWTSPTSYSHHCNRFHGVLRLVNRPQAQADPISRSFLGTKTPLYTSGLLGFSGESLTSRAVSGEANRGALESIAGYLTDADSQLDTDCWRLIKAAHRRPIAHTLLVWILWRLIDLRCYWLWRYAWYRWNCWGLYQGTCSSWISCVRLCACRFSCCNIDNLKQRQNLRPAITYATARHGLLPTPAFKAFKSSQPLITRPVSSWRSGWKL